MGNAQDARQALEGMMPRFQEALVRTFLTNLCYTRTKLRRRENLATSPKLRLPLGHLRCRRQPMAKHLVPPRHRRRCARCRRGPIGLE
jgi:hypothetical protein